MVLRALAFGVALAVGTLAALWLTRAPGSHSEVDDGRFPPAEAEWAAGNRLALRLAIPLGLGALSGLVAPGDWTELSQVLLLAVALAALALADARTLSVDTRIIVVGLTLRLLSLALLLPARLPSMIAGMLCGAGLLVLIGVFYRTLRNREGLGEGDAAVMGLVGSFVGWQGIFPALAVSALSGLLVALPALLIFRKPLTTTIPFVPFLALGGLVVYGVQLWHGWSWPLASQPDWWWLMAPPEPLR
ncbi:MAG: prepilin peptidase [Candidatus Lambdaproteobacteria bacterium]|nr:prepilin peptidase [Candidatus Lambdaproteobacteria bacterium]